MLVIERLRHWFGRDHTGTPALSCAGLELQRGEIVGLVGPSGSGKTTFLNIIGGLIAPSQGEVSVGAHRLSTMAERARERWRRDHCGLMFQNFHLDPNLSAERNVLLPVYFRAFSARPWRARAAQLLDEMQVTNRASPAGQCSRGEQQRIALARALLFDPQIVLADEPTASLDEDNAERTMARLKSVARSGRLVIVSTHDLSLLPHVDRVLRISHREVTEP